MIFPALNIESKNERYAHCFPNYKTMEYSLVREKTKTKTNKKTIYLRQLKLEGKEGGRPDGTSESINNVEVLILGEGTITITSIKHPKSKLTENDRNPTVILGSMVESIAQ